MIQKISTRDGYGKKLAELDNSNIVVLTADLAESTRVKAFAQKYPERFIQVGISEQDMFGIANGLGLNGKIAITNTFASFCLRGFDQIRILAINNSNVKIIGHHSGINGGQDGVSQQCEVDISMFRTLPNLTIVVPSDALEAQKALTEIVKLNGPCYLRLSREPSEVLTNEYSEFKIGKANILREGDDILIVSCGMMVAECLKAARLLEEKNIRATIMNMHTIKPLDIDSLLKYATKTRAVLTVEEHSIYGGLGSAVCEALAMTKIPVKIIGLNDVFGESGQPQELFEKNGLTAENIIKECDLLLTHKEQIVPTIKEVEDIIKDITVATGNTSNSSDTSINTVSSMTGDINSTPNSSNNNSNTTTNKTYEYDPRGRIIKMSEHDKKKVDDVLYKMFGGRKNR